MAKEQDTQPTQVNKDVAKQIDQPVDDLHKAITTDQYAGQGGTYIYDPKTGQRTPVSN